MKKVKFTNLVWKEGRYYVAQCLNVDISSFGTTKQAALKNLKEAIDLYFEDAPKVPSMRVEKFEMTTSVPTHA